MDEEALIGRTMPISRGRAAERGGSWNNNRRNARCANRNRNIPDNFNNNVGFRVVSHDPDGRPANPVVHRTRDGA